MAKGKLTADFVKAAGVGRHGDGGGLYLSVKSATSRNWVMRYMIDGRSREMGLGAAATVSLTEARARAAKARVDLDDGIDPLGERLPTTEQRKRDANAGITFRDLTTDYLAIHEGDWKNAKHKWQWRRSLEQYAFPVIGNKGVGEIDVSDLLQILRPIWSTKSETARRVRMRIERILSSAIARRLRYPPNPAAWSDNLEHILPTMSRKARVKHLAALDWREVPAFTNQLRERDGITTRALEFIMLTAVRSNEGRGARIAEFDLAERLWIIPAERMKSGRPHRVPLCGRAVEIVREMQPLAQRSDGLLFPGLGTGRPITDTAVAGVVKRMGEAVTVHGFRSSFRDWAAEATDFQNHVVEMSLAHTIGSAVEAAYRRGDLLAKRRELMEAWAAFCSGGGSATT